MIFWRILLEQFVFYHLFSQNAADSALQGVRYADLLCRLLKTLMCNLLAEHKAMSRSSALAAFRLIETVKVRFSKMI